MRIFRITDIKAETCFDTSYDLLFYASGYENRCTFVPSRLRLREESRVIVVGFDSFCDDKSRLSHDNFFKQQWKSTPSIVSGNDEGIIYELCREANLGGKRRLKVLVDYSSMSRLWYAGILNWARYAPEMESIDVDFIYAFGDYQEDRPQMVIDEILAVPGCEGGATRLGKSAALFGLGFDHLATLCVFDRLEPDFVYSYLASPASSGPYPAKVRELNKELITLSKATLELPIGSVERTVSNLVELVLPHLPSADVTLVPMGPKPHVLAAMLMAMRFAEIGCLRVSGKRSKPEAVEANGKMTATRVEFRPDIERKSVQTLSEPRVF